MLVRRAEILRGRERPADVWPDFPRHVIEDSRPVFFLSTGRCGTLLLTEILGRLDATLVHHAPLLELRGSEPLAYAQGGARSEAFELAVRVARFEMVMEAVLRGRAYLETSFRVTFFAPHLARVFPRSRFVHLVRDPGAFVRSAVSRGYYAGSYGDIGRIVPLSGEPAASWPGLGAHERCAWLWNETNAFVERFKQDVDPARVMTARAEDLFRDPAVTRTICEHAGLAPPPQDRVRRWLARPVNAQSFGREIGKFATWPTETQAAVRRRATLASTYGYAL